jgi:ABC-type sugar transport system ATPase subunit
MKLVARNVEVVLGGRPLLGGVDLDVEPGEVVGVLGRSGSGKTTLLRILAGLERPTSGSISIGSDDAGWRPVRLGDVSMSFQDDAVYEHLDVRSNLSFPLEMARVDKSVIAAAVGATARWTGIRHLLDRRAATLSGGERAAVATSRAAMPGKARFIALDEPLSHADLRRRAALSDTIRRIHQNREDVGIVVATNDWRDVVSVSDRVAVLESGVISQVGTPMELYEHPGTVSVAELVGEPAMNLFPGFVDRFGGIVELTIGRDRLRSDEVPEGAVGRTVLVGVRPERLHVARPETPFDRVIHATVGAVEQTTGVVRFGLGGVGSVAYAFASRTEFEPGDRLELTWAPDSARLFDVDTGRTIPK